MYSEDEDDALYDAVLHSKKEEINFFLSKKLEESCEESLLHVAVRKRNLHILEILAQRGADINEKYNDQTLIEIAIANDFPEIVESLIKNGANLNIPTKISIDKYNNNYTLVHKAVEVGNTEILQFLLKSGVDINPKTQPGIYPQICYKKIDENYKVHTACYYFMRLKDFHVFRRTLTPLEVAIVHYPEKAIEILDLLLKNGAAVEIESEEVFPIHLVIIESNRLLPIAKLLEYGANINSVCESLKCTPLSHAMIHGNSNIVSFLLDINAQDLEGDTPFHSAIKEENYAAAEILILCDTNIFVRNDKGDSPLKILNVNSQMLFCRFESMFRFHENKKGLKSSMTSYSRSERIVFLIIQSIILKEVRGNYLKEQDLHDTKTKFKIVYDFFKKELEEMKLRKVKKISPIMRF
ncbi:putative ankyrin repeat protein RF_0381 [Belonocnema kinseyi]|uniref:putative ankyrin repeat protein RF_0381 n=1 Tax=Belonocnema kinseyi TaxID=2817044 RepID=UPI00143DC79F|nr:putative ankyrin repeat protein RF_0381 [Belonocnema kinseyi]